MSGLYIPDVSLPQDGDFELWIAVKKDGTFSYNVRAGWHNGDRVAIPAADVRPVVLCKDCKNDCHCMIQDFMEDYGITPDDQNNFFCGYGEKEES